MDKCVHTHTYHTPTDKCVHTHTHTSCSGYTWLMTDISTPWHEELRTPDFLIRPHLGAEGREVTHISGVRSSVRQFIKLNCFPLLVQTVLILTSVTLPTLSPWHRIFHFLFAWVAPSLLVRSASQVLGVTLSRAVPDMLPHPRAGLAPSSVLT